MRKIEENFLNKWTEVRKEGRLRYALRTGILWSVFTAFLTKVFELSVHSFKEIYLTEAFFKYIAFFIIIGAMLFWKFVWEFNERRYAKLLKDKENESNSK